MLMLKLSRRGKKGHPTYRLIVIDKRKNPWGKFLEDLGSYHPLTKKINLKKEKILTWLEKGAKLTPTVHNLLVKHKIINKPKVKIKIKKRKEKEEKVTPTLSES